MGFKTTGSSAVEIWHNPRCTKSRQTLALLEESGVRPKVRLYLETPPGAADIESVLGKLDLEPRELMRKKEASYKDLGLQNLNFTRSQLIQAMVDNPVLIERPVVIKSDRAAIGRPPENVKKLL